MFVKVANIFVMGLVVDDTAVDGLDSKVVVVDGFCVEGNFTENM